MKTRLLICFAIFFGVLGIGSASGLTYTWSGATNTIWSTSGNWKLAGAPTAAVPTTTDDIIIPSTANLPVISVAAVTIKTLTITGSTTITLTKGLTVNSGVTVNSDLTLAGASVLNILSATGLVINGTCTASSSKSITATNLTINNSGTILTLAGILPSFANLICTNNATINYPTAFTATATTKITAGVLTLNGNALFSGGGLTITDGAGLVLASTTSSAIFATSNVGSTVGGLATFDVGSNTVKFTNVLNNYGKITCDGCTIDASAGGIITNNGTADIKNAIVTLNKAINNAGSFSLTSTNFTPPGTGQVIITQVYLR